MTRQIVFCAAVCFGILSGSFASAQPKDNEAARDKKLLQGTWEEVTIIVGGTQYEPAFPR